MDPHFNNPAGRLWQFSRALRLSQNPTEPLSHFLGKYFEIPRNPERPLDPKLFAAIQHIFVLPDQIEQAVRERERQIPPAEMVLRPLGNIRNALLQFMHLGVALNSVTAQFTDSDVSDLEHCSYYLDAEPSRARPVTADDLEQIRILAEEIMETLVDAQDLDPALKNFIWEHAAKIADAVRLARAAGAGVLTCALNEAIGDLVRHPAAQAEIAGDQTAGQKFFELLKKITLVVGLVGMPLAITADAVGLLQVEQNPAVVVVVSDSQPAEVVVAESISEEVPK